MARKVEQIRNIALIAHVGSGKTSLGEAMLFNAKATTRMGRVDDGSSNFDFEPEEIKRKITISSAIHHCNWKKHFINIIDTPGDDNFLSETKLALQGADGVVLVIDATAGVKVGTEKVWEFAEELKLPKIIFVSKMDRERADYFKVVQEVIDTFQAKATPVFIPLGAEDKFQGLIDLVKMKACVYEKDGSGNFQVSDVPADFSEDAEEWREKMIENIVEVDDELMEKYLEGEELSQQELEDALYKAIKSQIIIPVTCGASVLNIGTSQLMDLIVNGMPSPAERGPKEGLKPGTDEVVKRFPKEDEPFSSLVFKTVADPFAGRLSIIRVFSGKISSDSTVYNPNKDTNERVGQLLLMEGKKQQPVEEAGPGEIVAVAKLKDTTTGDTLCDPNSPVVFKPVDVLPAVLSYAVEAKAKGSEDKLFSSLARLVEEDPSLKLDRDQASSEIILSGRGQIHLEVACERLKRKFGVEAELKPLKVPYRETIKKPVKGVIYRHKKQTGGRGQFAEVHFDVFPLERGAGFEFKEELTGMNVPRNFVPAVEKGIKEALQNGVLAGYPVVDIKVRFYDGKSHEVDSSDMAFKIAASMCTKKALEQANPVLLEPIMKLEVTVPEEVMGDVMGDLTGRRGRVLGMESKGKYQVIKAEVPMSEILRYALDLNALTGGRGTFKVEFSHYEEVPPQLAEKIIAEAKKEKEKE